MSRRKQPPAAAEARATMPDTARLAVAGQEFEFPIVSGSEGERALNIGDLRARTGLVTLDRGFANTASCESTITFIDGERGILRYRGIPVEQLCLKSTFIETCYLLTHNRLPTMAQRDRFSDLLNAFSMLHEDMRHFYNFFPHDAHPMSILGTMVNALSSFHPHVDAKSLREEIDVSAARLISRVRTIAAFAYKKSIGEPVVYPRKDLKYCENFLNMMFSSPVKDYEIKRDHVKALNTLLILHADHEQNCSTSTVRLVGSAQANLYASISSGIAALWGPLHGGANQAVVEMLQHMRHRGGKAAKYLALAKDKRRKFRLAGFGHRIYKTHDPRAKIIKQICHRMIEDEAGSSPLLALALELEDQVLRDEYFIQRKLYPNVDFYSGLVYLALGIPVNMFTVMFAMGRMPGWIAHWKEMINDPEGKIGRPRQIYVGKAECDYLPVEDRG